MRQSLQKMIAEGKRTGRFTGTFIRRSQSGHVLLRGVRTPAGPEEHLWLRCEASALPEWHPGTRFRFTADVVPDEWRGRVNLENVRDLEVVG